MSLIQFLNEHYLDFFTGDGALLRGNEIFRPSDSVAPIDGNQLEAIVWTNVNIRAEVTATPPRLSVHGFLRAQLEASAAELILYDHGKGEVADFVTITRVDGTCQVAFYHCKGSATDAPGARVKDIYEVCSQAQKSVALANLPLLKARLRSRRHLTAFVRGDQQILSTVLDAALGMRSRFEVVVVQPGISKASLRNEHKQPMGATDLYLRSGGCAPLRIMASR